MESFLSTLSAKPRSFQIVFILSSGIAVAPDLMPHVLGRGLPSLVGAPSTIGVVDRLHLHLNPNLHAQSSASVLLGAPAWAGNSVKPSCIPFWESASGPQLLPTLGHHNFSFNSISAESCLAGPVNFSKWCLKYVPRATLSSQQLAFFGFNSFPKKEKRFCVCHWVGDLLPTSCFFPVFLLYPKMVLNRVAQYCNASIYSFEVSLQQIVVMVVCSDS